MVDPEPEIDGLRFGPRLFEGAARTRYRAKDTTGSSLIVDVVPTSAIDEAKRDSIVRLSARLRNDDPTLARVVRLGGITGRDGAPFLYLARMSIDGPTLGEDHAARRDAGTRGRSLPAAIALLQPIAKALDRLHGREQHHLLLSPSSIIMHVMHVTQGGERYLVDHGISALLALAGADPERTKEHAAPEQVDSALGVPSAFSDVFSLALVFMEVVLGASVFSFIAPSDYYTRLVDRGDRPSLREHGYRVAPSIERVLARALAVDPRSRYPRAGAFWDALVEAVRASPNMHALESSPKPRLEVPPSIPTTATPKLARVGVLTTSRQSQVLAAAVVLGVTVFGIETFWRSRMQSGGSSASSTSTNGSAIAASAPAPSTSAAVASSAPIPSVIPEKAPPAPMVSVDVGNVHFSIDRTEVSVADYRHCVDAGECTTTREYGYGWNPDDPLRKHFTCNLHVAGHDRHPVNCVSWNQATKFCAFVGKRLPREREWELSATGGTKRRFPWGHDTPTCKQAVFARYGTEQWGCKEEPVGTAELDAHPDTASPFGAIDLAGNLWEWTAEIEGNLGILRGGGWDSSESNLTTTARLEQAIFNGDVNVGFRCLKSP